MIKRIFAVFFIYICIVIAWMTLGGTVQYRTNKQDMDLRQAVGQLWGTVQNQKAPYIYYQTKKEVKVKETTQSAETKSVEKTEEQISNHYIPLEGSDIKVDLHLDQRKKGLLWYSTYRVGFTGKYRIVNRTDSTRQIYFAFDLPSQGSVYDNFRFIVGGRAIEDIQMESGQLIHSMQLAPFQTTEIQISYNCQGMDQWWYVFGDNVTQIKNFNLTMTTDFDSIDFPANGVSPTHKKKIQGGWELMWNYSNLLSGVQIGMDMPKKLNPGPWVNNVIYFAPVSLFLFFFLTLIFTTLKDVKIHPMNYFFIGAAYFSYHLLLSYLVDHVSIHISFWICSFVSIFLVVSYMKIVVGKKFAFLDIGLSQFVFLVLFSYTFFFKGYTGLAITIMCIITLFIVMQLTAKLDWENVFVAKDKGYRDNAINSYPTTPLGSGFGNETDIKIGE